MACYMYQLEHESFWGFFLRYGKFFLPGRNFEKWQMCHHLYEGLNRKTREFVDDFYHDAFFDQTPVICLNFFRWLAKDNFRKEYPGLPPLEVPPAYPLGTDYNGNPEGTELEKTWSVNQFQRSFEERLETHDHLVSMALDHDLDSPHPI